MCDTLSLFKLTPKSLSNKIPNINNFILGNCLCPHCYDIKTRHKALKKIIIFLKQQLHSIHKKSQNKHYRYDIDLNHINYLSRKILFNSLTI